MAGAKAAPEEKEKTHPEAGETKRLLEDKTPPSQKVRRASQEELVALRTLVDEHAKRLQDLESQIEAGGDQSDLKLGARGAAGGRGAARMPSKQGATSMPLPGLAPPPGAGVGLLNTPPRSSQGFSTPPGSSDRRPRKPSKSPVSSANGGSTPTGGGLRLMDGNASGTRQLHRNTAGYRGEEADPYDRMWSAARLHQTRIFDQDLLKSIYNKPYKEVKHQAALIGSGVVGLLSMPFGPIGMAAGGMFGAVFGGLIGFCADKRRRKKKIEESELEKKRLKSLVRWAAERFNEDDEVLHLIEMVTLEFKPMADIAEGSKNARKQLKLLDNWVAQKSVKRQLWVYMDNLLQNWQELTRVDFMRSMLVFQTLARMYKYTSRMLEDEEQQFVHRMERLLEHGSVKSVMAHAQHFPTQGESRVMECMVYADHAKQLTKRLSRLGPDGDNDRSKSPVPGNEDLGDDAEVPSDDSDIGGVEDYKLDATPGGLVLSPENMRAASKSSARPPTKVLKKPFFKSWDDFMDFDVNFKHKMPITLSEFNLLLEKEKESTVNWDVCVDRKEIRVAKVQIGGGCINLRAWATVPGVDMKVAFYLFHKHEERVIWDKVFANMGLVGDGVHGSDILYSMMRIPGVTPRDFLQYRRVLLQDDGSIAIVLRSAEHPDCPEGKSSIRAESYISGYVLRQAYENGEPVLKLFIMSCSDVKGLIPKWIINFVAPKKPGEWVDVLKKACVGYQETHTNGQEELKEYIARFEGENPYDYEVVQDGGGGGDGEGDADEGEEASDPLSLSPLGRQKLML